MSFGKAIIGGLLFGTTGFIVGALLGNDKKEVVNINVKQPIKPSIKDEFYEKLNDYDFESFVYEYCDENKLGINNLSNHLIENIMIDYDEMIEKGLNNG